MNETSAHQQTPRQGILLFAHGSSDPEWTAPVRAARSELAKKFPNREVAVAYLERATPDFAQAASQMAEQGITYIALLPIFLGVGKHLKEDLPVMIANFQNAHPGVQIEQLTAVGQTPSFAPWVASLVDDTQL